MARGAPGNAGGGGTDADPNGANPGGNDENAGGGGGGNGGSGGFGGDSWNTNLSIGGEGGVVFPATIDRLAMGGGGGAGTRNNSDGDNQASAGAAGGGIIFIRAYNLIGVATLTANGAICLQRNRERCGRWWRSRWNDRRALRQRRRKWPDAAGQRRPRRRCMGCAGYSAWQIVTVPAAVVAAEWSSSPALRLE